MTSDERPEAATNGPPRSLSQVLDLVLADAYRDSSGYYLIRPHTLDEVRRMAHVVRGLVPQLESPIKAEFTLLPPPADHRLVQREMLLDLPPDSYLRGLALDWPEGKSPRLVWTWSEPAPEVRHA